MIRLLKWGTLCLWTPTGSKMASRQSWKNEKKVRLKSATQLLRHSSTLVRKSLLGRISFTYFQLWRLAIFEPVGVQRHKVPHFKGLISANLNLRAQGCDSTFTFCHVLLKKAILLNKRPKVSYSFSLTVSIGFSWWLESARFAGTS